MKIIALEAENVKKVSLVRVDPKGAVVEIAGDNGSGKSSLLDAIEWALAGDRPIQWSPIRRGEQFARIELKLGDETLAYKVTKVIRAPKEGEEKFTTKLRVEDASGAPFRNPQATLDSFVGALTLDPMAFVESKPDERIALLKTLVEGFDFDSVEARRRRTFDLRTEQGRVAKRLKAEAAAITVPEDAPETAVDVAPLMSELEKIGEAMSEYVTALAARDVKVGEAERAEQLAFEARDLAEKLRLQADAKDDEAKRLDKEARMIRSLLSDTPGPAAPPDASAIRKKIDAAHAANEAHAKRTTKANRLAELADVEKGITEATALLAALDRSVERAIAEAELPVRGLALGEHDVTLGGVPFDQASFAEQIRASLALAMAENPELRIIRIRKGGNDLDQKAMAILAEVAEAESFQIWVERVVGGPGAVVLEDGHVRE